LQLVIEVRLADKLKYLREVEGSIRGLNRAISQSELVRFIAEEMDSSISQSYLSQIESGARPHLTNTTRLLLAKFFKVHPGYLVEDPEGYHAELLSDLRTQEDKLDIWLVAGSERFRKDAELCRALRTLARHADSRRCLLLLESILETPLLMERLLEILRPSTTASPNGQQSPRSSRSAPRLASAPLADSAIESQLTRRSSIPKRGGASKGSRPRMKQRKIQHSEEKS
jgi:transcriptional regulator with XRE-family HTH domain